MLLCSVLTSAALHTPMAVRLTPRFASQRCPAVVLQQGRKRAFIRNLFQRTPALEYASLCYLPTSWLEVPLVSRKEVSHDSTVYTFGLPKGRSLELPTCACILLDGPGDTVRP